MAEDIQKATSVSSRRLHVLWCATFVLLFLSTFVLSGVRAPNLSFDPSWQAVIEYATHHRWQYGKDILFTYGPLGFLNSPCSQGEMLGIRAVFAFIWSGMVAWVVVDTARKLPVNLRWLFLGWFLLVATFCDLEQNVFLVLPWCGIRLLAAKNRVSVTVTILTFFALLALVKFTFLMAVLLTLLIVSIVHFRHCRFPSGFALLTGGVGLFLIFWKILGQQFGNLLPWLKGSWQLMSGYSEAMVIHPQIRLLIVCILVATLFLVLFWKTVRSSRVDLTRAGTLLILLLYAFLCWKQGLVRADSEHIYRYLFNLPLLAGLLLIPVSLDPFKGLSNSLTLTLFVGIMLLCAIGVDFQNPGLLAKNVVEFPVRLLKSTMQLRNIITGRGTECFQWQDPGYRQLNGVELPVAKEIIGNATVDVLGALQWGAISSGLNYHPRPVIQGYSAYTPYLQQINRDFFLSEQRPDYLLLRMDTINRRFKTIDDALLIPLLLDNYLPVGQDNRFLILKASGSKPHAPQLELLAEQKMKFGTELALTRWNEWPLVMQAEVTPTIAGRVAGVLFNRPNLDIIVSNNGRTITSSFFPSMAKGGFLLNPLLLDADVVASYYKGFGARVDTVAFTAPLGFEWMFSDVINVKIYRLLTTQPLS